MKDAVAKTKPKPTSDHVFLASLLVKGTESAANLIHPADIDEKERQHGIDVWSEALAYNLPNLDDHGPILSLIVAGLWTIGTLAERWRSKPKTVKAQVVPAPGQEEQSA